MIAMPSIKTLAAIFMGILFGLCVLFFNLWRSEVESFSNYRSEVRAAGEVQSEATKKTISDQKQITEDTTNAWKAALDLTRSQYAGAGRVRKSPSSGTLPAVPGAACAADGAGQDPIPAAGALEEACAETTLTLNYLQNWVERQSIEASK